MGVRTIVDGWKKRAGPTRPTLNKIEMIEACVPDLRRYAFSLVRSRPEADDLVHDCLVRALERWDTRHDDLNPRPWLFAIMHNLFASQRRRARVRGHIIAFAATSSDSHSIPPAQEHQVELREAVRALDALPEEQRNVLILVTIADLSYAEVAEVLGVPIGTVMSRLSRGRERLRQLLEIGLKQ
jgi:RNA polymerase sigma factor (sigma-70 family)